MSQLVAIEFPDEHTAFAVRAELAKLQKEYLIEMKDVVVLTKDEKGKVKLHQAVNLTVTGAVSGSFWGMLIGILFLNPLLGAAILFLNPLLGAAVGAGAGALSGKLSDIGIDDKFMKEFSNDFVPGASALFVLFRQATADKVLERLKGFKGKVLKTNLSIDNEKKLRQVLEG